MVSGIRGLFRKRLRTLERRLARWIAGAAKKGRFKPILSAIERHEKAIPNGAACSVGICTRTYLLESELPDWVSLLAVFQLAPRQPQGRDLVAFMPYDAPEEPCTKCRGAGCDLNSFKVGPSGFHGLDLETNLKAEFDRLRATQGGVIRDLFLKLHEFGKDFPGPAASYQVGFRSWTDHLVSNARPVRSRIMVLGRYGFPLPSVSSVDAMIGTVRIQMSPEIEIRQFANACQVCKGTGFR